MRIILLFAIQRSRQAGAFDVFSERLACYASRMQTELIVALDVPKTADIAGIIDVLPADISWFKVGLELFCAAGPAALQPLIDRKRSIFLDLKLHDIPRTVERAVLSAAQHGADLITVHASGGRAMLQAAATAARSCGARRPRILAVTVLTSLDQGDFGELGIAREPSEHVLRLGELAAACGIDGLVCSPLEVARMRAAIGPEMLLVTPGIRFPESETGDQKRVGSPYQAAHDGATHIVVGRPILEAQDPHSAARRMQEELRRHG